MNALHEHIARDGFRLRGTAMSRVDGFADVVFGFALTLLVVSLEVPKNFAELHLLLRSFAPFSLTFLTLMLLWFTHYKFFRRYGLHDMTTIWLNGALLFLILYFVYPLKFMFNALFQTGVSVDNYGQVREMTLLYTVGFTAIYSLFALMYANALRRRERLDLTPMEVELSRLYLIKEASNAVIGVLVMLLALVLPAPKSPFATLAFLLITAPSRWVGRRIRIVSRSHHARLEGALIDM